MRALHQSGVDGLGLNNSQPLYCGEGTPLLRYQLFNGGPDQESRLVLTIHHALYDAWTLEKLLDDLNYNYVHPHAERDGRAPYSRFVHHTAIMNKVEAADYWTSHLANTPLARFPQVPHAEYRTLARSVLKYNEKLDLAHMRSYGISVATVLMAAYGLLLSSYCDEEDVYYGTILSGRDEASFEDIMGPTISTVPMRLAIKKSEKILRLLTSTQDTLLKMQEYQHYGLENISRLPGSGPWNASKFMSLLVIQHDTKHVTTDRKDRSLFDIVEEESQMLLDYPLVITASMNSAASELELKTQYDEHCIGAVQVLRMMRHLYHIVMQMISLKGLVGQLKIITAEDEAEILT